MTLRGRVRPRYHARMRPVLVVPILAALLPASFGAALRAQHEPPDTFGHSRHGGAFDEGPRQAAYAMAGMSDQVHFPVEGLSAEAQRFFDQGITQLHGFWYFESERSFRQVAKLHPDCAMAYWGMAMANVESPERAAGFVAAAVARSEGAPTRATTSSKTPPAPSGAPATRRASRRRRRRSPRRTRSARRT